MRSPSSSSGLVGSSPSLRTHSPSCFEEFYQTIPPGRHLDQSRKRFAERFCRTSGELMTGELVGRNRYNQLLLGRKAVGKTDLLHNLLVWAKQEYQELVVIDVPSPAGGRLPTFLVGDALGMDTSQFSRLSIRERVASITARCLAQKLRFLLALDEFQLVYSEACENGKEYILEIVALGELKTGNQYVIITGSAEIRVLAYKKASPKLIEDYPNYTGLDLNSTKYQPSWIHPFTQLGDFEIACKLVYANTQTPMPDLSWLYLNTGGVPGLLRDVPEDGYTLGFKDLSEDQTALLVFMLNYMTPPASYDFRDQAAAVFSSGVSMHVLRGKWSNETIYQLIDNTMILHDAQNEEVFFGSVAVYWRIRELKSPWELDIHQLPDKIQGKTIFSFD